MKVFSGQILQQTTKNPYTIQEMHTRTRLKVKVLTGILRYGIIFIESSLATENYLGHSQHQLIPALGNTAAK